MQSIKTLFQKNQLCKEFARFVLSLSALSFCFPAMGDLVRLKTSEPIYQNQFDLGAGGASLTRSTQEGVLYVNPSLSAFGKGFFRWFYLKQGLHIGADAADIAKGFINGKTPDTSQIMDTALSTPINLGIDVNVGFLTSLAGFGILSTTRIDIEGREFGSVGTPELRVRTSSINGAVGSVSKLLTNWFSVGLSTKYLYVGGLDENISLFDLMSGDMSEAVQKRLGVGQGIAVDAGATAQWQSKNLDFRLAGVVADIGQTKFTGNLEPFKQTINLGVGATLHTSGSATHCAYDQRDVLKAYSEHWTKRSYVGCKILFEQLIGFGAGFYQGYPSYSTIINLWIMRLEAGVYTKEMGAQVGTSPRRIYFSSIGFEI